MSPNDDAKARADLEAVNRDYPFDAGAVMHELRMPEKLRAMPDRELAASIYAGWRRTAERTAPVEVFKPREPSPAPVPPSEPTSSREWWDR